MKILIPLFLIALISGCTVIVASDNIELMQSSRFIGKE